MPPRSADDRPSRAFRASERYREAARALGQQVRDERQRQGLTLERAAEQIGLDFKHLQQIEAGTVNVTLATLLRIGDGLGAPLRTLLVGVDALWEGLTSDEAVGFHEERPGPNSQVGRASNPLSGPELDAGEVVAVAGRNVAAYRKAARLTQRELAERVEVSLQYVQRVEQGRQNLTIASLVKFANALRVDVALLLRASG